MKVNVADWKEVKLGKILRLLDQRITMDDEKEYLTITVKRRHGGLEIREKLFGYQIATKKQFGLIPGAFIISRVQCWHQAYAIVVDVPPNTIASQNYDQFAISPEVDTRFFWWLSHSPAFTETVRSSAVGVVIEKMVFNRDEWLTKSVRLPPLAEQRRVVARIEELAAQINEARELRKQAAEEIKALTSSTQSSLTHPEKVKLISIEDLVGENGLRNGKSVKSNGIESSVRCLTLSAMRNGRINILDSKPVPMSDKEATPFQIRQGDVYVIRGNGSKDLCGLAGLIIEEMPGIIFPDLFIQVALPKNRILPEFFVAAWNSSATRSMIEEKARTTSGIWKINQGHILSIRIPVPSLPEQRRIVAELDALQAEVDKLKKLQSETAQELDALLPSILDKAFKVLS